MKTFRILREGKEVARVTAENLEFSKVSKLNSKTMETERVDDRFLFKMVDPEDKDAVFVVALSHKKDLMVVEDESA